MSEKLVLIDGNSIIYRAFYALPLLNNDKGVYTNAVYGFTTMLLCILEEEQPTHMLVAYDAGKTTFRHKTYGDYKERRQKTPPELSEQFPLTKELLEAFQISHYELDLYEADDIIGTLSQVGQKENMDVKVISGDQDLLQLVSNQVTVDLTKKGISEVESYTPSFLKEKMEITPDQVIDLKGLMGDTSDNIPGVPGVGIKTATKLLKQYETIENLYDHIEDITAKKLKENLTTYKDDAFMSKDLVTIKDKMEITSDQVIDLKGLMGDTSDNIPGVPGVGIKTATKLLKQYETIENLYDHIEDITAKKLKENLTTYKDDAFMSKDLVTI